MNIEEISISVVMAGSVADIPKHQSAKTCMAARKYCCTLKEGHSGPHVAESDKVLDTWED